jgi:hypothetical protein
LDDPVDGRDELRGVCASVRGSDLDADDPSVGRYAAVGGSRRGSIRGCQGVVVAGDEPGHERAVPVGVEVAQIVRLRLERKVRAVKDLVSCVESGDGRDA